MAYYIRKLDYKEMSETVLDNIDGFLNSLSEVEEINNGKNQLLSIKLFNLEDYLKILYPKKLP